MKSTSRHSSSIGTRADPESFTITSTASIFLVSLVVGSLVIALYLFTTTYTYVVKANAQYLSFLTLDRQVHWSIQGFSLCEEIDYGETDLFADPVSEPGCSYQLNSVETQKSSKLEISENVRVTFSWLEGKGLIVDLYHPEHAGTLRFFSSPTGEVQPPKELKGNVRLTLANNEKSHELLLYGANFEVGQLPAVGSLSSLKEGSLEAYGAREFLQSYRYLISTEDLSLGGVVKLKNAAKHDQSGLYTQGFLRIASYSGGTDHFYVRLSPPYKYDGKVQHVTVETTEFGGESKLHKPNLFEVIQRDNHLAIVITLFAVFIAIAALGRALMDLRELLSEFKIGIKSNDKK